MRNLTEFSDDELDPPEQLPDVEDDPSASVPAESVDAVAYWTLWAISTGILPPVAVLEVYAFPIARLTGRYLNASNDVGWGRVRRLHYAADRVLRRRRAERINEDGGGRGAKANFATDPTWGSTHYQ